MISEVFRNIFVSILVELFVLIVSLIFKDKPLRMVAILALGTVFAGLVGFGPSLLPSAIAQLTSPPAATSSPSIQSDSGSNGSNAGPTLPLQSTSASNPRVPTSTRNDSQSVGDKSGAKLLPQSILVFQDDFDDARLDGARWTISNTAGGVTLGNGMLQLASSSIRYPYIFTRDDAFSSSGDVEFTTRFRYSKVDVCGSGIQLTNYIVPAGLSQDASAARQDAAEDNGVGAGVWQDSKEGLSIKYKSGTDRRRFLISGSDRDWHKLGIRYVGNRYEIFLDDNLIYTSQPTRFRPRFIWMGNPVDLGVGFDCPWDTMQIDYIKTESLP